MYRVEMYARVRRACRVEGMSNPRGLAGVRVGPQDGATCATPVDLWLAGGGKYHRNRRRKIPTPSEVLPCWKTGIEAAVNTPRAQDAFLFGFYTGMRLNEVLPLSSISERGETLATLACSIWPVPMAEI